MQGKASCRLGHAFGAKAVGREHDNGQLRGAVASDNVCAVIWYEVAAPPPLGRRTLLGAGCVQGNRGEPKLGHEG